MNWLSRFLLPVVTLTASIAARAQDHFEIQVYEAEITEAHTLQVELHSNYTSIGTTAKDGDVLPSNHGENETIELTKGWGHHFETGFYIFNSVVAGQYYYAGSHIRPRYTAPEEWHLPVGISLSSEIGYITKYFTANCWDWEIRPIIDKKWKSFYVAFNPAIDKVLSGPGCSRGFAFIPALKLSENVAKKLALGLEYYGSTGLIAHPDPVSAQQHNIYLVADLDYFENWEINAGYGIGMTQGSDSGIFKLILGYKFGHHIGQKKGDMARLPYKNPTRLAQM